MINFAVTSQKDDHRLEKVRNVVIAITTVILIIYILVIVGIVGWGAYWSRRQTNVSTRYIDLNSQVVSMADKEVIVRKLASRSELIKSFINERLDLTTLTRQATAEGVVMDGFTINSAGKAVARVSGSGVAAIKSYTDEMVVKFSGVDIDSLTWTNAGGWQAVVNLGGLKK